MKDKKYIICPNENELAQFIEGTLNREREDCILKHLDNCNECREIVNLVLQSDWANDKNIVQTSTEDIVSGFAAKADKKLCVLYTEQYILQLHDINASIEELLLISKQNKWIKRYGVQFKNVGKLLEYYGIRTERKTNAKLVDIQSTLAQGSKIIVGIDAGELFATRRLKRIAEKIEDWVEEQADHVALVSNIIIEDGIPEKVEILDVSAGKKKSYVVSISQFLDAWADSKNFMVKIR